MITLSAFRARYPEFDQIGDSLVTSALTEAEAQTDAEVFGTNVNAAHATLAAHVLVSNPNGREARLNTSKLGGDGETVYLAERRRLERLHCSHWVQP